MERRLFLTSPTKGGLLCVLSSDEMRTFTFQKTGPGVGREDDGCFEKNGNAVEMTRLRMYHKKLDGVLVIQVFSLSLLCHKIDKSS